MAAVFGILQEERLKWRGIKTKAEDIAWIEEVVKSLVTEPLRVDSLQAVAV